MDPPILFAIYIKPGICTNHALGARRFSMPQSSKRGHNAVNDCGCWALAAGSRAAEPPALLSERSGFWIHQEHSDIFAAFHA